MAYALITNAASNGLNGGTTTGVDTTGATLLILTVGWYDGTTADVTVSDSKGNTWTPLTKKSDTGLSTRMWYCDSPTVGSAHTFTVSGSGTYSAVSVSAWSGSTTGAYGTENSAYSAVANSLAAGSVTPAVDGSLVVTACSFAATGTFSIGSGFTITNQQNYNGATNEGHAQAYLIQGTAAAINPTWSQTGGATQIETVIATFAPSGGGGGSAIPKIIQQMGI